MEVLILDESSAPAAAEADYVRVEMWCDPEQDTVTLATIERVVQKSIVKPSAPPRRVKKLIDKQPMTLDDAVEFATSYAAAKNIPVVVTAADRGH